MSALETRVSEAWLALREPADAAARASELVDRLGREPPASGHWVIHDLGCGTGAMGRWLTPLLPGPQRWVLHDLDTDLLEAAAGRLPGLAADGAAVTIEAKPSDITRLRPGDLGGANLVTASALLDLLTAEELAQVIDVWAGLRCPMLFTLSVIGHVALTPANALDRRVADAFNAHQRRMTARGGLLGPDAVYFAVKQLRRLGAETLVRPSPWRLGAGQADLEAEWLIGWLGAACEQDVELAAEAESYIRRRLAQAAAGELAVTVGHVDLLVSPR